MAHFTLIFLSLIIPCVFTFAAQDWSVVYRYDILTARQTTFEPNRLYQIMFLCGYFKMNRGEREENARLRCVILLCQIKWLLL